MAEAEMMEVDVVIAGAGPTGLAAAIRLMQLALEQNREISVCVLEKGSEVGAHILSGAVIEPRALSELFPDWKERGAPLTVSAEKEEFLLLTTQKSFALPVPPQMRNHGNYIASLGNLTRWLGQQAEAMGVQIFPGFPAAELIYENGEVQGLRTGAFGVAKDGSHKDGYQPGMDIRAKVTLLAEGCRGSLSQQVMSLFHLRDDADPQTYAIGIKELWEIPAEKHRPGTITHTIGWPLDASTYGGSFLYHMEHRQIAIGLVVGLDYTNPYLDPFMEFQRFKTHPHIRALLEGGKRISYGARALNEGGYQSIPKLIFPGGAIIGASAGFMNVPKIKGSHTAMKSGMLAAEAAYQAITGSRSGLELYPKSLHESWVAEELREVRNIRPGFRIGGLWGGLVHAAIDTFLFRGRAPWTLRNHADHNALKKKQQCRKIEYPRPDGALTFDRMSSVFLSNTAHEENQPCHLKLRDPNIPIQVNLALYDAPEQRYCPAGVYEIVEEQGTPRLQINAPNCVHCKTCDIKDPSQNIVWTTPEGGGGPNYPNM